MASAASYLWDVFLFVPVWEGRIMYEAPTIVYEGDLEVQAGSPGGNPLWDDTALGD
jgi:hypothetical protein